LVKINEADLVIQIGQNSYEIPISDIEDLQDVQNPMEIERVTGVDVVLTVKGDNAPIRTKVKNMFPRGEVPLPLLTTPRDDQLRESDFKVLKERTDRWQRANNLMNTIAPPKTTMEAPEGGDVEGGEEFSGLTEHCTIRRVCTSMTRYPAGGYVCDRYEGLQCNGY
jgi:hypothetical protein